MPLFDCVLYISSIASHCIYYCILLHNMLYYIYFDLIGYNRLVIYVYKNFIMWNLWTSSKSTPESTSMYIYSHFELLDPPAETRPHASQNEHCSTSPTWFRIHKTQTRNDPTQYLPSHSDRLREIDHQNEILLTKMNKISQIIYSNISRLKKAFIYLTA
jgi:hypothetical protein